MSRIKNFIKKYIPVPALISYMLVPIAAAVHIAAICNCRFADWYQSTVGSGVRTVLAYITNYIPFSVAETVIILIPVIIFLLIFIGIKTVNKDDVSGSRYIAGLLAAVCMFYNIFVLGFGTGYYTTPLGEKMGLEKKEVNAAALYVTSNIVKGKLDDIVNDIEFRYGSSSVMPYDMNTMVKKINDSYMEVCSDYRFLTKIRTNIKRIALSEPMTYTHIAGIYTYYTGEANLNTNTPDYTLPFTVAHELSHQRGISREDEANFMGMMVCINSDDIYIQYSGYLTVLEYLMNALYEADTEVYNKFERSLDRRIIYEERAFNEFFSKYQKNIAHDVSSAVNDLYLKAQGQTDGVKSYDNVVYLAVSYFMDGKE